MNFVDLNGEWGWGSDLIETVWDAAHTVNDFVYDVGVAVGDVVTLVGTNISNDLQQVGDWVGNQISSTIANDGNLISSAVYSFGTGMQTGASLFGERFTCQFTYNLGGNIASAVDVQARIELINLLIRNSNLLADAALAGTDILVGIGFSKKATIIGIPTGALMSVGGQLCFVFHLFYVFYLTNSSM